MNHAKLLLPAALLVAAAGCKKDPPKRSNIIPVTVANSERRDAPYVVTSNGTVEPRETAQVQSQVSGLILRVHFQEGDEVTKGQVLFEIDPRPYQAAVSQARAVLAKDQAQATATQRDAERYATLAQKDYVTKSQADQTQAAAAAAQASVSADRAAVETAQLNLANATVRAPISGRTGGVKVRAGNLVSPGGETLVVINQIHPILVRFTIPDKALPDVQQYSRGTSLPMQVTTGNGGPPVTGALTFLENAVDTTTGTVTLKGEFPNTESRLWPGQYVSVSLQLFVQKGAVVVPKSAILTGQQGNYVYVVGTDNRVTPKTVSVGRPLGELIVIDQGLAPGLKVVTDGQAKLTPNAVVAIKPSAQGPSGGATQANAGGTE
jgi:multidrug efflux system membrane fusion protein